LATLLCDDLRAPGRRGHRDLGDLRLPGPVPHDLAEARLAMYRITRCVGSQALNLSGYQ